MTKKNCIEEILRLNRVLVQMKYDEEDDKNIKKLIAENLKILSKIEQEQREAREQNKIDKELAKHRSCFAGGSFC